MRVVPCVDSCEASVAANHSVPILLSSANFSHATPGVLILPLLLWIDSIDHYTYSMFRLLDFTRSGLWPEHRSEIRPLMEFLGGEHDLDEVRTLSILLCHFCLSCVVLP